MVSVLLWCVAVPVILYAVRKYRVRCWGRCKDERLLKGKCFIVTGANCGIGKETVRALAIRNACVIMGCRDVGKAKEAIKDIRETVTTGELIPMELDLSSMKSIECFAAEVMRSFERIHVLVNNAGVSVSPGNGETKEGVEINMGVNHIGHFYLTSLLLDLLKKSAPSRIIVVASKLHEKGKIDFDNWLAQEGVNELKENSAYANSKLANVYFCRELSKQLPPGVETYAVCPGFAFTSLARHASIPWYQYVLFAPLALIVLRSAEQACQTILHCALSDDVTGHSGKIFRDCKLYNSAHNFNDDVQKKLWEATDQVVQKYK